MGKVVIGIHGLGNKPEKARLKLWWEMAMREGLKKHCGFNSNFKFEIIYWADMLNPYPLSEDITDEESPLRLVEKYVPGPENFKVEDHSIRQKVLDFIEEQMDKIFLNDDMSINYSFITDMLVHKYFKELEIYYSDNPEMMIDGRVYFKELVRKRTYEILKKYKNDKIYFIGHSMGSIIAYDVLVNNSEELNVDTFATIGSPLGMPIIISKTIWELKKKNSDIKELSSPNSIKNKWINFADLEDKVALVYDLGNNFVCNTSGICVEDVIVHNDYIINGERNPHKSYGYLRTPEFSKSLYEFLTCDKSRLRKWFAGLSASSIKKIKYILRKN